MVFRSITSQIAKENEKFVFGAVRDGGRAIEFAEAIEWLVSAGMQESLISYISIMHRKD